MARFLDLSDNDLMKQTRGTRPEPTGLGKLVKDRLAELGLGPYAAENIAGVGANYFADLIKGRKRSITADNIAKVAKTLQWTEAQLAERIAGTSDQPSQPKPPTGTPRFAEMLPVPDLTQLPTTMPVRGLALASAAGQTSMTKATDFVRRPPGLRFAENAYALYVHGASMAPKFDPGDLVFINPDRPAIPGDVVVILQKSFEQPGTYAWLKFLEHPRKAGYISGRQLNSPGIVDYAEATISAVHRVCKMRELLDL